jgi:site-specific DNA-methyltransferase (cytosine-N4-specific)
MASVYETFFGRMLQGRAEEVLRSEAMERVRGRVQLILTSPPFPLLRQKEYGNVQGQSYVDWLASYADLFRDLITVNGSIVIEVGNSWERARPVMSTVSLQALLAFLDRGRLSLCQQFVAYNPSALPGPIEWVNIERIRVKNAFSHVWWMSLTDRPKADNRRVLQPYSAAMRDLLNGRAQRGTRQSPSGHVICGSRFTRDQGGAIPGNVLIYPNTVSNDAYIAYCRRHGLPIHPARMPAGMAEFFIRFLSEPGDLVLDPFAGSNTTGAVAERLGRRWLAIEPCEEYIRGSLGRFEGAGKQIPLWTGEGEDAARG